MPAEANLVHPKNAHRWDVLVESRLAPEIDPGRQDDAASWREAFLEAGVPVEVVGECEDLLDRAVEQAAYHRTAAALAWIGQRLSNHSTGSASVAAALGIHQAPDGTAASLAELAERFAVTKQGLHNLARQLRPLFAPAAVLREREVLIRPSEPGEWVTGPELHQRLRISGERAKKLGIRTTRGRHRQLFYDAGDARTKVAAAAVAEAAAAAERDRAARISSDASIKP